MKKKKLKPVPEAMAPSEKKNPGVAERLQWWEEARFGLFIHWGLYALPAGRWKGKYYEGIGEWIMHSARIPVKEYEQLAEKFNPVKFDAEEWVKIAVEAGTKYLVITAKHHDGFALFDSPCSGYDIMDATPFGRDPMKELAAACRKAGLPFGFYYSQTQDWHEPGGIGNTWDFEKPSAGDFQEYLDQKVKPQLRELLTRYGPIALIWFDTPMEMTREQSMDLKKFVQNIQPECLVSGRIGNNVGDYGSLADNQVPRSGPGIVGAWETPATLNDTWGYKRDDRNWKSARVLLELLVDLAGKGINYLLNVGPTAEGTIPGSSIHRLKAIGKWLSVNGEAIYGTRGGPYPYTFSWGRMTQKENRLYLHFFQWPKGLFRLYGLRNKVLKAKVLGEESISPHWEQTTQELSEVEELLIQLPKRRPRSEIPVLRLELEGVPDAEQVPMQQPDGRLELPAPLAILHNRTGATPIRLGQSGVLENWRNKQNWVSWDFRLLRPGCFTVRVFLSTSRVSRKLIGGHRVEASVAGSKLRGTLTAKNVLEGAQARYFKEAFTELGTVEIKKPGIYTLKLKTRKINQNAPAGIVMSAVEFTTQRAV